MFKLKKKRLVRSCVGVFLLLIIASLIPHLRNRALNTLKYPLGLFTLIEREVKGIIFYHRNLAQNERFKREIDLLKKKVNDANEIYIENSRLKELLSFKQNSSYKVIAAQIIGRSADNWSSVIIINKGSSSGIKRNMAVITYLGLAGRVMESTSSTSQIMLINDPNFALSGIVQRSRQEGLVAGTLGGYLMMKYLPKDSDIKISDLIVTSGLTPGYPKGLLIGRVVDLGEDFSGLLRYAIVKPAVNLANIEEVLIIVP